MITINKFPSPLDNPMGDGHHTDVPPTKEDQALGQHLASFIGTMYADIEIEDKELCHQFFYKECTSTEEWTRVARALRIHGLKIVSMEKAE